MISTKAGNFSVDWVLVLHHARSICLAGTGLAGTSLQERRLSVFVKVSRVETRRPR
jgi:hypothetical protein